MSAPPKSSSRWGSFLQQAVAGVESRLDTILAEGGDDTTRLDKPHQSAPAVSAAPASRSENGLSRTSSTSSRTADRLQERLARAVAAKNIANQKTDISGTPSATPSLIASPVPAAEKDLRVTEDISQNEETSKSEKGEEDNVSGLQIIEAEAETEKQQYPAENDEETRTDQSRPEALPPRTSTDSNRSQPTEPASDTIQTSLDGALTKSEAENNLRDIVASVAEAEYSSMLTQLQSNYEASELLRQQEVHDYVERIDALQAKLQYLAKEAAETARSAANSAAAGSFEKRLAEKDEQIALLLDEGQKLSKNELKQTTIIRKLRAKAQDDAKEFGEMKLKTDKVENEKSVLKDRLNRTELVEKQSIERQKVIARMQKDLDVSRAERDVKNTRIAELEARLVEANSQARQDEMKAVQDRLDMGNKRVSSLEDDFSNLKIEKELASERFRTQLKEITEKNEREKERYKLAEMDSKAEQQALESKLEMFRSRAEEASSGATGDAQAKLLRQIETLQSQYAVASDNWQGIEASLTSRATTLERERDEASRRESELRRKAREATLRSKKLEIEVDELRLNLQSLNSEIAASKKLLETLKRRADSAESALNDARTARVAEIEALKSDMQTRLDEERTKWRDEMSGTATQDSSRIQSPGVAAPRALTTEFLGLQNLQIRRASSRTQINDIPLADRLSSRRSSVLPAHSSGRITPQRQSSAALFSPIIDSIETPSVVAIDNDDPFDNALIPGSPQQTVNDIVSVSTAGAGPSVQLVERMSAAVRRLESEKVATKEELDRLSIQRDEARSEIVKLMQQMEANKSADDKVQKLESEVKDINARYQTTLEMLGEKSELVEELKADVQDVKAMYRELVERTIK